MRFNISSIYVWDNVMPEVYTYIRSNCTCCTTCSGPGLGPAENFVISLSCCREEVSVGDTAENRDSHRRRLQNASSSSDDPESETLKAREKVGFMMARWKLSCLELRAHRKEELTGSEVKSSQEVKSLPPRSQEGKNIQHNTLFTTAATAKMSMWSFVLMFRTAPLLWDC